jgi:UDP-2-acetamido-3-amino-2,3-dideoxy-glucuronate N-acetyltransferase
VNRPWFQHDAAIVESPHIGPGTRIWAFAHVLANARIGADCNICDHVFVENDVVIGDRVTLKCGVQVWDGVTLEDDVFVGPNATFTNDPFPRSLHHREKFMPTLVKAGASIGANATILCGTTIGARAMVGGGAVVTRDVPPNAIVSGNPAFITGYVDMKRLSIAQPEGSLSVRREALNVGGASIVHMAEFEDLRGALVPAEVDKELPFSPKRVFVVRNVTNRHVRGEHAHRALHQFLVCVHGDCCVVVDDGRLRREVHLNAPTIGLHVPAMVWSTQYKFSADAVLIVLASDVYDSADYIRTYDEYLLLVGVTPPGQTSAS